MKFSTTTIFKVATAVAAMFCIISGATITEKPKPYEVNVRVGETLQILEHVPIVGTFFGSLQHVINGLSGFTSGLEGITGNSPSNPLGILSGQSGSHPFEGITGESPSMEEGILGDSLSNKPQTGLPIEGGGIIGNSLSPGGGGGGGGGGIGNGLIKTLLDLVDSILSALGLNANENGLLTPVLKLLNI